MTELNPLNRQTLTLYKEVAIGDTSILTVGKFKKTSIADDNLNGIIGAQMIALSPHTEIVEGVYINVLVEPDIFEDRSADGEENIYEYEIEMDTETIPKPMRGIDSDNTVVPPTKYQESMQKKHPEGNTVAIVSSAELIAWLVALMKANVANRFLQSFCFDKTTDVTVGEGRTFFKIPTKFNNDTLAIANATVIEAGLTGDTTIQLAMTPPEVAFGDETTQFDITNPSGDVYRYTFDGTGTDPNIEDAVTSVQVGDEIHIKTINFNSANNGVFTITGAGDNYFETTNASGVVESDKAIGDGAIQRRRWTDMLSTPITMESGKLSGSGVIDAPNAILLTDGLIRPDIDSVSAIAPLGLLINLEATG